MSSVFIHVVALSENNFFLCLNNISCYGCTTFYSAIHPLTDIWVVHLLAIVISANMNMHIPISILDSTFNSFGYIPRNGIWDHMVITVLIFQVTDLPLAVATPFYIPANNAQVFQFLHSLDNICCPPEFFAFCFHYFFLHHIVGMRWHSVWFYLALLISDVEHLSCAYWPFVYHLFIYLFIFGFAGSVVACGLSSYSELGLLL